MHHSFDRSFYLTVVYFLLIYARLTICAGESSFASPTYCKLSTETAFFLLFGFFVVVHFCFSLQSFSLSSASPLFVVAGHGLSFVHFCFSCRRLVIQSFISPSCRRCRLLSHFVVGLLFVHFSLSSPSSACHLFTSASHSQCQLVVVLRVLQESYKSGYRPVRYLTNFLLLCSVQ